MRERSPLIKTALLGNARSLLRDLENELPPEITPDRFAGELKDSLHRLHGLGWRPNHIADRLAAVAPGLTAADVARVLGLDGDAISTAPLGAAHEVSADTGDDYHTRDPNADDDGGLLPDPPQEPDAPPALMDLDMGARPDPSLLAELADEGDDTANDEDAILSALNDLVGSMDADAAPGGTEDEDADDDDAHARPRFMINDADEGDENENEDEDAGDDDAPARPRFMINDANDGDENEDDGATDDDLDIDALDLSADNLRVPSPGHTGDYRSKTDDNSGEIMSVGELLNRDAGDDREARAPDEDTNDDALDDQLSGILSRLKELGELADEPAEPEKPSPSPPPPPPPAPATGPVRLRVELPADHGDRYRDQFLERGFIQQDDGSWITTALQPPDAERFELKLRSIGGLAKRVTETTPPPKTGAKKIKTVTRSRKKAAS
jgi:hypothetical protein